MLSAWRHISAVRIGRIDQYHKPESYLFANLKWHYSVNNDVLVSNAFTSDPYS